MQVSDLESPEQWLIDAFGGGSTSASGVRVTRGTVLTSGPVYQAVTLISSDLAKLDVRVFDPAKEQDKDRPNHPAARIFNRMGNSEMSAFHVRQTLVGNALIHGNGIGVIEWANGRPVGIWPIPPHYVQMVRVPFNEEFSGLGLAGRYVYKVTPPYQSGPTQFFMPDEIFHFKLFGNGLWGFSPLTLFTDTFGRGLAMEQFQGSSFANQTRPSGILSKEYGQYMPKKLSPDDRRDLRNDWNEVHQGAGNAGKVAIVTGGLRWTPLSITHEQAQMLESRQFFREEVAGIYNLPAHKLNSLDNSSVRANLEEQNRAYVQGTLDPHMCGLKQEIIAKLFSQRDRNSTLDVMFNKQELYKSDIKTRMDAYAVAMNWGLTTANRVAKLEGWEGFGPSGDVRFVPLNMANAETGESFGQPEPPPEPVGEITEEVVEENLRYARDVLQAWHSREVLSLRKHLTRKDHYQEWCEGFYSREPEKLVAGLRSLTKLSAFVDEENLSEAVESYVTDSFDTFRGVESRDELEGLALQLPQRVENFLPSLLRQS